MEVDAPPMGEMMARWITRRPAMRFMAGMMLSLLVTLVAVGAVQYTLVARTLMASASDQLLVTHSADAKVLHGLHDAEGGGLPAVRELLNHMAARPGVMRVALLRPDGTVLAVGKAGHGKQASHGAPAPQVGAAGDASGATHGSGAPHGGPDAAAPQMGKAGGHGAGDAPDGAHGAPHAGAGAAPVMDPTDSQHSMNTKDSTDSMDTGRMGGSHGESGGTGPVAGMATTGNASVSSEESDAVVRVPVHLESGVAVLEVVRSGADLRDQVAALRYVLLMTLAGALLLAPPLFYLVGGRRLSARHGEAVETSATDGLTGLGNHRGFYEKIQDSAASAKKEQTPLSVVLIDLDGFKQVNDSGGHRRGDAVLGSVAYVLRQHAEGRAYRIGGDEFALLLPSTTGDEALLLAERIRYDVEEQVRLVTVSVGVATLTARYADVETLLGAADGALYEAKHLGRNRVVDATQMGVAGEAARMSPTGTMLPAPRQSDGTDTAGTRASRDYR